MPLDDLLDYAKSDKDFYALLGEGVHAGSTDKEISRAYRRSALKSHPDQNPDDANAAERFHILQIAYDVLSDPAAKEAYDAARAARRRRERQTEMLQGKRRAMMEDLERREGGAGKRKRDEVDAEEKLAMEIRRLAADGKRRRMEREQALRSEAEAVALRQREVVATRQRAEESTAAVPAGGGSVPEMSRTVKVRWPRDGDGKDVGKDKVEALFAKFGQIEDVVIMPDRKMRIADERKKRQIATAVIIYASIVSAHAAVEDLKKQTGDEWAVFEKIEWAEGKEPEFGQLGNGKAAGGEGSSTALPERLPSEPAESSSAGGNATQPTLPSAFVAKFGTAQAEAQTDSGLRKIPAFGSFKTANNGAASNSPSANASQAPSFEEITLMRMKNAEKQRLEEQIRRAEQEADALQNGA